jgi:hypothetical protein
MHDGCMSSDKIVTSIANHLIGYGMLTIQCSDPLTSTHSPEYN